MKLWLALPGYYADHQKGRSFLSGFRPGRMAAAILGLFCWLLMGHQASAQCSSASINWDWQYKVSAFTSPARFGLGVNAMTMTWGPDVTPASPAVNNAFTGYGTGGYGAGRLAQFTVRNGVITLTFDAEVQNVKLAVYDLDNDQAVTVTARNGAASAQSVVLRPSNANSQVTVSGSNTASATATGYSKSLNNSATSSGVNIDVGGPVKTITLTFSKASNGADDVWLSDLAACVTGDYATGYPAVATPEAGQPGYVLAVEGNHVYAINTGNAQALRLFTDGGWRPSTPWLMTPITRWFTMPMAPGPPPINLSLNTM